MNWVLEHMDDADFNDPLPASGAAAASASSSSAAAAAGEAGVDAEALVMLTSLGFTERQAEAALKATGGDAARGAEWLFSHTDNLDTAVAEVSLDELEVTDRWKLEMSVGNLKYPLETRGKQLEHFSNLLEP